MGTLIFHGGTVILEDRLLSGARVEVDGARIAAIRTGPEAECHDQPEIDPDRPTLFY